MDTYYCDHCGLLHDHSEGECEGCKLTNELNELKAICRKVAAHGIMKGAMDEDWSLVIALGAVVDKNSSKEFIDINKQQIKDRSIL